MADTNNIIIVGRLVKDAAMKSEGLLPIAFFTIASNRKKKDENGIYVDEASFFDVNVYGKYAEAIFDRLQKGVLVAVDGSLKQERWKDRNSGENKSRIIITADNIQIFGGRHE